MRIYEVNREVRVDRMGGFRSIQYDRAQRVRLVPTKSCCTVQYDKKDVENNESMALNRGRSRVGR